MNASAAVLQPETLFHNRYRILRCIKAGGMGAVYEVLDEATSSRRALKVMLPSLVGSEELRARFALEARITGSIESDHIVRTSDAGVEPQTGTPFLVMELLRGEELGSLVKKRRGLLAEEVVVYLFQAALALDRTHGAGIVHRDLKPDNLFVTVRDDGSPCVKILDFGIAKVVEQHPANMTQHMLGTPVYMAPEQIRAERNIGPRADVHALGHVAYTLLVGESYWAEEADMCGSAFMLATEIIRGPVEPPTTRARRRRNRTLPDAFDAWFFTITAALPEDRFHSALIAIEELAAALSVTLPRVSRTVLVPETPAPVEAPENWQSSDATVPSAARQAALRARGTTPAVHVVAANASPSGAASASSASDPASTPTGRSSEARAPSPSSRTPSPVARYEPVAPRSTDSSRRPALTHGTGKATLGAPLRRNRSVERRFTVRADPGTGILRLKVWGFWDVAEGKAYLEEFRRVASNLLEGRTNAGSKRRWYVLADISEFPAQKPEVNVFVEQTMAYATANGMLKAANLVSSALTRMQIGRLSADMGLPEFSFFTSEAEAVAWLLRAD